MIVPTSRMGTSLYPFTREKEKRKKKKVTAFVIIHFLFFFLLAFVVKPVDRQGTSSTSWFQPCM